MSICENLMKLYPTPELFQAGRSKYGTWLNMSKALHVSEGSLYRHKTTLGMPKKQPAVIAKNFAEHLTAEEITMNIKKLIQGMTVNIVKVYDIVKPDLFYQNQRAYEGLEFIREDKGATWAQVTHSMMPYAIAGRGQ